MSNEVVQLRPDLTRGTPKSMGEAICRALESSGYRIEPIMGASLALDIEANVRDYLAQSFTAAFFGRISVQELWAQISGPERKPGWFVRDILDRKARNEELHGE